MVIDKIHFDWNTVKNVISDIHEKTSSSDKGNIGIIGISRGGLVPAVLLSHYKENSHFFTVGVKSYSGQNRGKESIYQVPSIDVLTDLDTIYLVDDICDTGMTFKHLINKTFNGLKVHTISLTYRSNSLYQPDFYGKEIVDDSWVVFPWEKE